MLDRHNWILLIDLDETIFDFKRAEALAVRKTLEGFGIQADETLISAYSAINQMMWEKLERGEVTREEVLHDRFRILSDRYCLGLDPHQVQLVYERNLGSFGFYLEGAEELLKTLKASGFRLFALTNGTESVQKRRLESTGAINYFEKVFISAVMGVNKPDLSYYEACFQEIDHFEKNRAIMIGDSLSSDMLGANNAGVTAFWYNPSGKEVPETLRIDMSFDSLRELPNLLDQFIQQNTDSVS